MLTTYPWQDSAWEHVSRMLDKQRMPHALLLIGNEGMGLEHFANLLAQRLLCLDVDTSGKPCGRCQSCQLFSAGSHPDIRFIEPEEKGKQIKIAQIRSLIEFVALKSFSNRIKVAILTPAEQMNRATSNALLKTLEEPPEQSMLILLSHRPDRLPITIRSRCQRIVFKPEYGQDTIDWLQQQNLDSDYPAELLLHLADGGPLNVAELLDDESLQHRKTLIKDVNALVRDKTDPVRLAVAWENFGCQRVIIWLMQLCQDVVRLKLLEDKAKIMNKDLQRELQEMAKSMDLNRIMRLYGFLQHKYQQSTAPMNYNSLSILEEIIIYWNNPIQVPQI